MFGVELFLGSVAVTVLIGVLTVVLLYWYSTRNHDYWKKRGIPFTEPVPLFGNLFELYKKRTHELDFEKFQKFGTLYGAFEGNNPVLYVSDPKLIRDIFVKDFAAFPSRRIFETGEKVFDSLLFLLKGEDWKRIRTIVSPTFTTGKIKKLMNIFKDCSETLVQNIKQMSKENRSVDVKKLFGAFTMDVIASSAFSTKLDSHNDPENEFVKTANGAFSRNNFRFLIFFLLPRLRPSMRYLEKKGIFLDFIGFFTKVTLQIIEERKRTGQGRNDFLQLLLDTVKEGGEEEKQASSKKEIESDIISNYGEVDVGQQIYKNVTAKDLSLDELVAQCIVFFLAGSESTSSALSFAIFMLATNPNVMNRLRKEVDKTLEETDGVLNYEAVQGMNYLDNVISETLRLFPTALRLERRADTDYELGNTGVTVTKGMLVIVPLYALHRDPNNFSNPDDFDPDRFTPEQREKREPYSYLPFGVGPRNCVAMRFALMELKTCLAYVVAHFNITTCPETKIPLDYLHTQGFLIPKDLKVDMQPRNDCLLKK